MALSIVCRGTHWTQVTLYKLYQIIDLSIIIQSAHRQMLLNWQETGASETRNVVPTARIAT